MSHSAKRQYLLVIIERYQKAGRKEKKFILDEFWAVCGYNRKYALRLLNSPLQLRTTKRGRKPKSNSDYANMGAGERRRIREEKWSDR